MKPLKAAEPETIIIETQTLISLIEIAPLSRLKTAICRLINVTPVRKWCYTYEVKTSIPLFTGSIYMDELYQKWYAISPTRITNITQIHEAYRTRKLIPMSLEGRT